MIKPVMVFVWDRCCVAVIHIDGSECGDEEHADDGACGAAPQEEGLHAPAHQVAPWITLVFACCFQYG